MPFDEIAIDLPELINQPYLCLNSMNRLAIRTTVRSVPIETQSSSRYVKIASCNFHFFICWETKWSIWLFLWNKTTSMITLKIANNLRFQNRLFYNIVIFWCGDGKYHDSYIFWIKNDWSWLCENSTFKNPRTKTL